MDIGPWPEISPACVAADSSFAHPAIRTTAFVDAFGDNGVRASICDDSFAPAMQIIADRIGDVISP
jgi:hypothetical protein